MEKLRSIGDVWIIDENGLALDLTTLEWAEVDVVEDVDEQARLLRNAGDWDADCGGHEMEEYARVLEAVEGDVGEEALAPLKKYIRSHCARCGEEMDPFWQVRSTGAHSYTSEQGEYCEGCWHSAYAGDGHCYEGAFGREKEAREHAAFMSVE